METGAGAGSSVAWSIAPMLSVQQGARAVEFYKSAFGAIEVYRVEAPDGAVVSQLSVRGAESWLSDESPELGHFNPESLGGDRPDDPDRAGSRRHVRAGAGGRGPRGLRSGASSRVATRSSGRSIRRSLGDRPPARVVDHRPSIRRRRDRSAGGTAVASSARGPVHGPMVTTVVELSPGPSSARTGCAVRRRPKATAARQRGDRPARLHQELGQMVH
jgi:hypothetical protein